MNEEKKDYSEFEFVSVDEYIGTKLKKKSKRKSQNKSKRKKGKLSKTIGITLASVQILLTFIFACSLYLVGIFPNKILILVCSILGVFDIAIMALQVMAKDKAILGKAVCLLMSMVLFISSYYMFSISGVMKSVSGSNTKMTKMVVAVLADDPANTIQDAANYNFGVQHEIKGYDVRQTVDIINEELGREIKTTVCDNIQKQAEALHDKKVDAIILNEAYCPILDDEFGDFTKKVKFIYSYTFTIEMVNNSDANLKTDAFTVYISGIDVYGPIETNSRSDVNIMAVVNPTTHQILLVTTPRDYYVDFPDVTDGALDKLTHAGIYGVDVSMNTLDKLYDTETEFYARVNFTSLIEIVDALGGVDVYSEYEFTTGNLNVRKGMNHFNGEQALAFSRERYNLPGGDFQRGKNQQAVITAMIQKVISPDILKSANAIMETVGKTVDTNMSQEQMQDLIKGQLENPASWNVTSIAAEGVGDKQYCYSMPGMLLYVTQPNKESVENVSNAIKMVEKGEIFSETE